MLWDVQAITAQLLRIRIKSPAAPTAYQLSIWSMVTLAMLVTGNLLVRGAMFAPLPKLPDDEAGYYALAIALRDGHIPNIEVISYIRDGRFPGLDLSPAYVFVYAAFLPLAPDHAHHALRLFLALGFVYAAHAAARAYTDTFGAFLSAVIIAVNPFLASSFTIHLAAAACLTVALALFLHNRPCIALAILVACISVRSEFILPVMLLAVPFIRRRDWRTLRPAALIGVLVAAYALIVPSSFTNPGGRFIVAFGQHYAWTLKDAGWDGNNWTDWPVVLVRDFGNAHSLFGLFSSNAAAFLWHIGYNLSLLPASLFAAVTSVGIVAWAVWLICGNRRTTMTNVYTCLACTSLLIPWLIIRPRPEYLIALVTPILLLTLLIPTWVRAHYAHSQ